MLPNNESHPRARVRTIVELEILPENCSSSEHEGRHSVDGSTIDPFQTLHLDYVIAVSRALLRTTYLLRA